MQSQLTHPSAHDREPEPEPGVAVHHPVEDEHHEKSTKVLKKVKEKAKKIKNTLTGHGHGHEHEPGHDHEHIPDDHDLDEEDDADEDEDEEMVVDPEVHGAPIYESAAVRSGFTGQPESMSHPGKAFTPLVEEVVPPGTKVFPIEPPAPTRPADPVQGSRQEGSQGGLRTPQNTPVSLSPAIHLTGETTVSAEPERTFVPGKEEAPGQPKVNLERPRGLEEDPAAPNGGSGGSSTISNYQTKVTDPTGKGGEEAGMAPMIHALGEMKVSDEPGPQQEWPRKTKDPLAQFSTGSHNQFSPEPTPPYPITPLLGNPSSESEATDVKRNKNQQMDEEGQPKQRSYMEKITSTTSVVADKAVAAKNVVASKLGYGDKDAKAEGHGTHEGEEAKSGSAVEYGKKITSTLTEKLTPVYEKVKETGTSVMSKIPPTGKGPIGKAQDGSSEMTKRPLSGTGTNTEVGAKGQGKGVSMKDYFAEKLNPGDEDKALSEVIAETLQRRGKEVKPKGKVTESQEVAKRLGGFGDERSKEEEKHGSSFTGDSQMGAVDKLKEAVSSWFGGQQVAPKESSSQSLGSTKGGAEGFSGSAKGAFGQTGAGAEAGSGRLQESEN